MIHDLNILVNLLTLWSQAKKPLITNMSQEVKTSTRKGGMEGGVTGGGRAGGRAREGGREGEREGETDGV
jgi:hypothetical protein